MPADPEFVQEKLRRYDNEVSAIDHIINDRQTELDEAKAAKHAVLKAKERFLEDVESVKGA